jgi:two-component system response regulator NreC
MGAEGFVVKTAVDVELLGVIRAVAQGRTVIDQFVTPELPIPSGAQSHASGIGERGPASQLTEREREVLHRVVDGYSDGEIAAQLELEAKSVEEYKSTGMDKLGLATRAELVRLALERGGLLLPGKPSR